MADSRAQAEVRSQVENFLRASYDEVHVDSAGDYVVRRDDVVTWVRPLALDDDGPTVVVVWSIPVVDLRVDDELTRFLATEANSLAFGQFELHDSPDRVHVRHALLGDFLSREELEVAVDAVASATARYGPLLTERFGGRLFSEAAGGVPAEGLQLLEMLALAEAARRAQRLMAVQRVFGIAGFLVGIAGGVAAYTQTSEWGLAVFVFLTTAYVIGRGVADVITDPKKVRRAVYFAIPPATATGVLYVTHQWWDRWWLAALLGLTVGVLLGAVIAGILLPGIAREEAEDDRRRRDALRRL